LLSVISIWPAGQAVGSWQKKVQKFKSSKVQEFSCQWAVGSWQISHRKTKIVNSFVIFTTILPQNVIRHSSFKKSVGQTFYFLLA
jgi:hypothetical protein